MKYAVSHESAYRNFRMVVNLIQKERMNQKAWIEILEVCCENSKDEKVVNYVLAQIKKDLTRENKFRMFEASANSGSVARVERFLNLNGQFIDISEKIAPEQILLDSAVRHGHLELFKYAEKMHENRYGKPLSILYVEKLMKTALNFGHLPIVKHLHEKYDIFNLSVRDCISTYKPKEKSFCYVFEQCQPACKADKKSIRDMLRRRNSLSIETVRFIFEKFEKFLEPFVMLQHAVARNRKHYEFCRDKIDMTKLSRRKCSYLLKEEAIHRGLDFFLYVKSDLSQRVPKFSEWWPKIRTSLLDYLREFECTDILEYFLVETMTQEERNEYLLNQLGNNFMNETILELTLHHATNRKEALKVARGESADYIHDYLKIRGELSDDEE